MVSPNNDDKLGTVVNRGADTNRTLKYPLAKSQEDAFQMPHYTHWKDTCNEDAFEAFSASDRDAFIASINITATLLSPIPGVSEAAGILGILFDFLWPEPELDFQKIWEGLMDAAEEMVDQKIEAYARSKALSELEGLKNTLRLYIEAASDYNEAPNDSAAQERVRDQFRATNTIFNFAMPSFRVPGFEIPLLAVYTQAADLHLLLLRDAVAFGAGWGLAQAEIDDMYTELQTRTTVYTDFSTTTYERGLDEAKSLQVDLCDFNRYPWLRYNQGWREEEDPNCSTQLLNERGEFLQDIEIRQGAFRWAPGEYEQLERWNLFNEFRRNMTIMAMDIVSLWPTFDPKVYPTKFAVKSELTRELFTDIRGTTYRSDQSLNSISAIEERMIPKPRLFSWLTALDIFWKNVGHQDDWTAGQILTGLKKYFKTTLSDNTYIPAIEGQVSNDVTKTGNYYPDNYFTNVITQQWFEPRIFQLYTNIGTLFVNQGSIVERNPFWAKGPREDIYNPSQRNNNLLDHHLSWITYEPVRHDAPFVWPQYSQLGAMAFGWSHDSVNIHNTIETDKITQIPAVKAESIANPYGGIARVRKGPGNTGGDLVELNAVSGGMPRMQLRYMHSEIKNYLIRIRYASHTGGRLNEVLPSGATIQINLEQTYSGNLTSYQNFRYVDIGVATLGNGQNISTFEAAIGTNVIIDKIEFIPLEGSIEVYEADQKVEKARKAVNALFTNDAKNALKLNVTDFEIDQVANLVDCLSDKFCQQEKMILLDQAKFAKRLSQERNLLNYGDFESEQWAGENGWKTSTHVKTLSDKPIFKGRYLHMPGASNSLTGDEIFPTYAFQKVDESKLKEFTRYIVRGTISNSRDLELLAERYGKEVLVKMDVPDDIVRSRSRNECGGWNHCGDQLNRTVDRKSCEEAPQMKGPYHTSSRTKCENSHSTANMDKVIPHEHRSDDAKDPHVFSYHIDTGCVDLEENLGILLCLKIESAGGMANIDNLEIIEAHPLTGEALARVKNREKIWKEKMIQKRFKSERAIQASQEAINNLFTNADQNRLKFESNFKNILNADILTQRIPFVYSPFLMDAVPPVPGVNYEIYHQLSLSLIQARRFYESRNIVQNGTFHRGDMIWTVTDGVEVQSIGNSSVIVLSEWSDEAFQNLHIDADQGYVLRVTARKEGDGEGYVVISDCDNVIGKVMFTSCDYVGTDRSEQNIREETNYTSCKDTIWNEEMTHPSTMLTGYVTKRTEVFPYTDRIRIDIGETSGTFKVESVELIRLTDR